MLKFLVLCIVLGQGICEILSKKTNSETYTNPPSISSISTPKIMETDANLQEILKTRDGNEEAMYKFELARFFLFKAVDVLNGHYGFVATNQVFNLNGPFGWKTLFGRSRSMTNVGTELPADYVVTNGIGAHKLHLRKLSWNGARKICAEEGGHLAVIRTDSEEKIVLQMMVENSVDEAWLGVHDQFEEGNWVTVLDEPLTFTGWARWSTLFPVNPDNFKGNQHCARLVGNGRGMDDDTCTNPKPFVCKI